MALNLHISNRDFVLVTALSLALGTGTIYCLEDINFSSAMIWSFQCMFKFVGESIAPTSSPSAVFQACFKFWGGLYLLFLGAFVMPPFLRAYNAQREGKIRLRPKKRVDDILLVDPVDWEKVRSVFNELRKNRKQFRLIVVSDTLPNVPLNLEAEEQIVFIKGNLRAEETYQRAGIDWAKCAIICASTYNNPDVADAKSAATTLLIERYRSEIRTVVEVVSQKNQDLFIGDNAADALVFFDPTTLGEISRLVAEAAQGKEVKVLVNTFDADQKVELEAQLAAAGLVQSDDGMQVKIVLPSDMDNPSQSDMLAVAQVRRATEEAVVVLYLSVESKDLFPRMAICADQVMARALVEAML